MPNEKKLMPDRSLWITALAALPASSCIDLIKHLSANYCVRYKTLPQDGLGMLKLKESAFQESYFLGEFPVASAWVEITAQNDEKFEGAAQIMDDNKDQVAAFAIADAILANELPGWEQLAVQVAAGMELQEKTKQIRKAMLAKTQVDFSLLDANGSMGSE